MFVARLGTPLPARSRFVHRRWHAACSVLLALALTACGGDAPSSTAVTSTTPPVAVPPAASPPPATPPATVALTITNTAPPSYQWDSLGVGKTVHVDVTESFIAVPGKYRGLKFLRTANANRFLSAANGIAFQTNRDVAVLVAYDLQAVTTRPTWLADWTDTGDALTTSATVYRIFRKTFPSGTVTLGGNELGGNSYTVVVDDGSALGNSGPTISGQAPSEIGATRAYVFLPTAGDNDGDPLTFAAQNLPPWAALDASTGALSGTPAASQLGIYTGIVVAVSDGTTTASLHPFDITVNATDANSAPVISGLPRTVIATDNIYTFVPTASDADDDPLEFSVTNLPGWANFYSATGRISGTPGTGDVGAYSSVIISVSDRKKTTSLPAFSVQVEAEATPNSQPTISGAPLTSSTVGQTYGFTPTAADPNGDALTFSIDNRPPWAAFNSNTGRLSGTPGSSHAGVYANIVIRVSDGIDTATLPSFAITVAAAIQGGGAPAPTPIPASNPPPTTPPPATNSPPQISGTPATTARQDQAYSFTPSASDTDGNSLTFSITNRPTWTTFNSTTGRLSGTPPAAAVGTHGGIAISVSDGQATRSLPTFAITVAAAPPSAPPPSTPPPNSPPSISGTPATTVSQDQSYSFTPSASDGDGDRLTFSIANRPTWASFSTTTGRLTGTPSATSVGTYSGIVISVSDAEEARSLPTFTVTVAPTTTGSATLSWMPPTQNTDGSPLTNLSGYKIYWGRSPRNYANSVTLNNPGLASYVIEQLTSGQWYFSTTSFNSAGIESGYSNEGSKTIP